MDYQLTIYCLSMKGLWLFHRLRCGEGWLGGVVPEVPRLVHVSFMPSFHILDTLITRSKSRLVPVWFLCCYYLDLVSATNKIYIGCAFKNNLITDLQL